MNPNTVNFDDVNASGTVANVGNIYLTGTDISFGGTLSLDFAQHAFRSVTVSDDLTFDAPTGAPTIFAGGGLPTISLRMISDGTERTLAFPDDWKFLGTQPTSLAADKVAVLTITAFGANPTDIVAAYGVET